jgi:hypothetical protein
VARIVRNFQRRVLVLVPIAREDGAKDDRSVVVVVVSVKSVAMIAVHVESGISVHALHGVRAMTSGLRETMISVRVSPESFRAASDQGEITNLARRVRTSAGTVISDRANRADSDPTTVVETEIFVRTSREDLAAGSAATAVLVRCHLMDHAVRAERLDKVVLVTTKRHADVPRKIVAD